MEKQIKIPTSNGKYIYGTLRGSLQKPLIVFVHGYTADMNKHIFFNGAHYFEKLGFSTFRFHLYHWAKDARKLHECTLKTHGYDFDRVVSYFRKKGAKKIFVVGHSYGGKTILVSKKADYDAVVLWDPSHNSYPLFRKARYLKSLGGYIDFEGSYGVLVGKLMVREEKTFPWKEKIRAVHVPVKIIGAGKGVLVKGCKAYYAQANKPKALVIIPKAKHNFNEEGTEEKLFQETAKWFARFKGTKKF